MDIAKADLRARLKQARLEMTDAERTLKSRAVVERLLALRDWPAVKNLHYFEPIRQLLEVDISGFVTFIEDNYPDTKLFTPRLIGGDWQLVAVKAGRPPAQFDAVIVPMLGFDKALNRIGYGGGYYDKFLASQPQARKIGVCFDTGRVAAIPTEPHDIPLDVIVTETSVHAS